MKNLDKKIKINLDVIKALNPCKNRLDAYISKFSDFEGCLIDFLSIKGLRAQDKIWVVLKVIPRFELEVFAIDCAVRAQNYAADAAAYAAAYAAYAADAAAYAAYAAASAAAADAVVADFAADFAADARLQERENQVDALIHICKGM